MSSVVIRHFLSSFLLSSPLSIYSSCCHRHHRYRHDRHYNFYCHHRSRCFIVFVAVIVITVTVDVIVVNRRRRLHLRHQPCSALVAVENLETAATSATAAQA